MKKEDLAVSFTWEKHMRPIWKGGNVYEETAMFVGETGECTLVFIPKGKVFVRNYTLDTMYEEGKDYVITGRTIRRVEGSAIPYIAFDAYYLKEMATYDIGVDNSYAEIPLEGKRYLAYGEKSTFTCRQISLSYVTDEQLDFSQEQEKVFSDLIEKWQTEKRGSVLFYGDSITVGCNASGCVYGGELPPYTPSWVDITGELLKRVSNADLEIVNNAVGGWNAGNGVQALEERVTYRPFDLMVLAFGMNDCWTDIEVWRKQMRVIADGYFAKNPNGYLLFVSTMMPNRLSTWRGQHEAQEAVLAELKKEYPNAGLARVSSAFLTVEKTGKRTRDLLANNINHPNDFGVRLYAQTIGATLVGEENLIK